MYGDGCRGTRSGAGTASNPRTGKIRFSQRFTPDQYNLETALQDASPPLPNDRAHGYSVMGGIMETELSNNLTVKNYD